MKKEAVRSHLKNFVNVNTPSIIEKFGQLLEMLLRIIYGMSETIAYGKYGTLTYTPPTFPPPADFLFANAPRELLEQVLLEHNLQPEEWVEWTSPYICLIVKTDDYLVLVDTGAGGLAPTTGRLMQNLQDVRIAYGEAGAVNGLSRTAPVFDHTCEGLGLRFFRAIHPYYYLTELIVCCDIPFKSQV
jgi:hypothetical protein